MLRNNPKSIDTAKLSRNPRNLHSDDEKRKDMQ